MIGRSARAREIFSCRGEPGVAKMVHLELRPEERGMFVIASGHVRHAALVIEFDDGCEPRGLASIGRPLVVRHANDYGLDARIALCVGRLEDHGIFARVATSSFAFGARG